MGGSGRVRWSLAALTAAAVLLIGAPAAGAAVFQVDSLGDGADASPGDGTCADGGGACTTRAAIEEANALPSDDVVELMEGRAKTFDRLDIADNGTLLIRGKGARGELTRIDVNGEDRVMDVDPGAELTIVKTTITGGYNSSAGGIDVEEGATVFLDRSRVVGNFAHSENGGGIRVKSLGRLVADRSVISRNFADADGGGIDLRANATALLTETRVRANHSDDDGSGINVQGMELARQRGGALPSIKLVRSTVSSNQAEDNGSVRGDNGARIVIISSTVADNVTDSNFGGGGDGGISITDGELVLKHSTVAYNQVLDGESDDSGSLELNNSTAIIRSSILAEGRNLEGLNNCSIDETSSVVSEGHNGTDDDTCGLTAATDVNDPQLQLGRLRFNGGPTETIRIHREGPLYGSGGRKCPNRDQRLLSRPRGGACEIGSFERKR